MLEVIGSDHDAHEVFVMVGLGRRAQWYLNVTAGGALEVDRLRAVPTRLSGLARVDAATVLAGYERRNRLFVFVVRLTLSRLVGWRYDGSAAARERLVEECPVLAFRPAA
jgi:hypothetical protein